VTEQLLQLFWQHSCLPRRIEECGSWCKSCLLKRGIDKAVEAGVAKFLRDSKKVSDREEVRQVATVSANWDDEIGEIIADAMDKVGKDGTITVEEAKSIETTLMWLKVCSLIRVT
jgi:chaperonin GroEL (HSP60 family)